MAIGSRLPPTPSVSNAASPVPKAVDLTKVPEEIQVKGQKAYLDVRFGSDGDAKTNPFYASLQTPGGRVKAKVVSMVAYKPTDAADSTGKARGTELFRLSAKNLESLQSESTVRVPRNQMGVLQFMESLYVVAEVVPPGATKPVKIRGVASYDDEL